MALKTTVKVSHVSNLSDARYCAGMGVEMLGFGVVPSGRHYIAPEVFQDIRGWISGPRIIAEIYGLSGPGSIADIIKAYAPDYLEMSWEEYRAFGALVQLPCIVELPATSAMPPLETNDSILYFVAKETEQCRDMAPRPLRVLKKISTLESLHKSLEDGCFSGFVLQGPEALRPGVTNYDQLGDILEALEED